MYSRYWNSHHNFYNVFSYCALKAVNCRVAQIAAETQDVSNYFRTYTFFTLLFIKYFFVNFIKVNQLFLLCDLFNIHAIWDRCSAFPLYNLHVILFYPQCIALTTDTFILCHRDWLASKTVSDSHLNILEVLYNL